MATIIGYKHYLWNPKPKKRDTDIKADGTDQTSNLRAAIARGEVILPPGRIVFADELRLDCPVHGSGRWISNLYRATPQARIVLQPGTRSVVLRDFSMLSDLSLPDYYYGMIRYDNQNGGLYDILFKNIGFWGPNDGVNAISIKTHEAAPAIGVTCDGLEVKNVGRMGFEITNAWAQDITVKNSKFFGTGLVRIGVGQANGMGVSYAMTGGGENLKTYRNQYKSCFYAGVEIAGNFNSVSIYDEVFGAGCGTSVSSSGGLQTNVRIFDCTDNDTTSRESWKLYSCDGAEIYDCAIKRAVNVRANDLRLYDNSIKVDGTAMRFESGARGSILRRNIIEAAKAGVVLTNAHNNDFRENVILSGSGRAPVEQGASSSGNLF